MAWTIKQVTEKIGFSADTLRYYDKKGIVSPIRHKNKYRYYDENNITILKLIAVMKQTHFSLAETKSMERLFTGKPIFRYNEGCTTILDTKIVELNQTIHSYQIAWETRKQYIVRCLLN